MFALHYPNKVFFLRDEKTKKLRNNHYDFITFKDWDKFNKLPEKLRKNYYVVDKKGNSNIFAYISKIVKKLGNAHNANSFEIAENVHNENLRIGILQIQKQFNFRLDKHHLEQQYNKIIDAFVETEGLPSYWAIKQLSHYIKGLSYYNQLVDIVFNNYRKELPNIAIHKELLGDFIYHAALFSFLYACQIYANVMYHPIKYFRNIGEKCWFYSGKMIHQYDNCLKKYPPSDIIPGSINPYESEKIYKKYQLYAIYTLNCEWVDKRININNQAEDVSLSRYTFTVYDLKRILMEFGPLVALGAFSRSTEEHKLEFSKANEFAANNDRGRSGHVIAIHGVDVFNNKVTFFDPNIDPIVTKIGDYYAGHTQFQMDFDRFKLLLYPMIKMKRTKKILFYPLYYYDKNKYRDLETVLKQLAGTYYKAHTLPVNTSQKL